jgi:Endonuclease/Exonuclease/phosphatase family
LAIDGFNMFRMDRQGGKGGGLALYVNERLEANLKEALINSGFKESIWCSVRLEDSRLLVGLCHRCPSSDSANDDALLRLLDQAVSLAGNSHVLIMGDFNYPEIDLQLETV